MTPFAIGEVEAMPKKSGNRGRVSCLPKEGEK